ncbi:swr complex subunit [Elasticomyces elasticus]|nr:swr complex subunit [Elasticomyces elasticus]
MPPQKEKEKSAIAIEADALDAEEEYDENEDEDFNPDKAAPADEDASSSDDEEAEISAAKPFKQSKKRKADVIEELDSGDEVTIRDRKRKRKRKDEDVVEADESGGEGGFVRTRAQRVAEKVERKEKKRTEVGDVTINVDDVWEELKRIPIGRPPPPPPAGEDDLDGEQDNENEAADEELITIRRRIEYAGEVTEIEETVPRSSKAAQQYLKEQASDQPAAPTAVLRRPLRRPSAFEPNPTAIIKGVPPERLRLRAPSRVDVLLAAQRQEEEAKKKAEKMTTVQKSALDWRGFVEKQGLKDELEAYGKGKGGYLAREDFLGRADMAREVAAREARLKGNMEPTLMPNQNTQIRPIHSYRLISQGYGGTYTLTKTATDSPIIAQIGTYGCFTTVGVYFAIDEQSCFAAHIDAHIKHGCEGVLFDQRIRSKTMKEQLAQIIRAALERESAEQAWRMDGNEWLGRGVVVVCERPSDD